MNSVAIVGNLTKDPEIRTAGEKKVAMYTVAVTRNKEQSDFISVVSFDKSADLIEKYAKKGRKIAVQGRIQTRNYDDKDGKRVYVTEVVSTNIEFVDKVETTQAQAKEPPTVDPFLKDEDLPF